MFIYITFFILLTSIIFGNASLISTITHNQLNLIIKRWKPGVILFDDKVSLISVMNGGIERYTNMIINCYANNITYGLIHINYNDKLSIFAIKNNSILVSSLTGVTDVSEFKSIVKAVLEWNKLILNKTLILSDKYISDLDNDNNDYDNNDYDNNDYDNNDSY